MTSLKLFSNKYAAALTQFSQSVKESTSVLQDQMVPVNVAQPRAESDTSSSLGPDESKDSKEESTESTSAMTSSLQNIK